MFRRKLKLFDYRIRRQLRDLKIPKGFHILLSLISHTGDSLVVFPLLIILWWDSGFSITEGPFFILSSSLFALGITAVVKQGFKRKRPAGTWGNIYRQTDPHSFPSGHAARTAAVALVFMIFFIPVTGALLFLWSLLVGFSRIILGVHFFWDVMAGFFIGLIAGFVIILLVYFTGTWEVLAFAG